MAGPRPLVSPPMLVPRDYGLLSVVQSRYDEPDAHWRNGVTFQQTCGAGANTFDDYCVTGVGAPAKTENVSVDTFGALPFTAYVEIDCSGPGYTEAEHQQRALDALVRVEEYQVEQAFWTGTVAAGAGGYTVYPHLAANAVVLDPNGSPNPLSFITLQQAATAVTGVTLDVVEGLGRLEDALGDCVQGKGVIHVTVAVFDALVAQHLIETRSGRAWTVRGNAVAVGDGYPGTGPTGALTAGAHWMYATGQIFAYRSSSGMVGGANFKEMYDRQTNTAKMIAERTYVLGFGCCHLAVAVSLGGVVSGTYNSAT